MTYDTKRKAPPARKRVYLMGPEKNMFARSLANMIERFQLKLEKIREMPDYTRKFCP